jgi:hypothetical protein
MDKVTFTGIGNTYGEVSIIESAGKFYLELGDCFYTEPEEIPEYLYNALLKYSTDNGKKTNEVERYLNLPDKPTL